MSNAPVKSLMDIDPNFKLPESIPENMSFDKKEVTAGRIALQV